MSEYRPDTYSVCEKCKGRCVVYLPDEQKRLGGTLCPECQGKHQNCVKRPMTDPEWLEDLEIRVRALESRIEYDQEVRRYKQETGDE